VIRVPRGMGEGSMITVVEDLVLERKTTAQASKYKYMTYWILQILIEFIHDNGGVKLRRKIDLN
jgi:hypothetical protein